MMEVLKIPEFFGKIAFLMMACGLVDCCYLLIFGVIICLFCVSVDNDFGSYDNLNV